DSEFVRNWRTEDKSPGFNADNNVNALVPKLVGHPLYGCFQRRSVLEQCGNILKTDPRLRKIGNHTNKRLKVHVGSPFAACAGCVQASLRLYSRSTAVPKVISSDQPLDQPAHGRRFRTTIVHCTASRNQGLADGPQTI